PASAGRPPPALSTALVRRRPPVGSASALLPRCPPGFPGGTHPACRAGSAGSGGVRRSGHRSAGRGSEAVLGPRRTHPRAQMRVGVELLARQPPAVGRVVADAAVPAGDLDPALVVEFVEVLGVGVPDTVHGYSASR